jgi:DNA-binding CsgD family transcriptional regulator
MIKLIEKQKIIMSHYREGKSQRQISKELNINRRTISKYIQIIRIKSQAYQF